MYYNGKKIYKEHTDGGFSYRKDYLESVERFIDRVLEEGKSERREYASPEKLMNNQEQYRNDFMKMIGVPAIEESIPTAKKEFVGEDDMCKIYRLSIETFSDFFFYGMLFVPHKTNNAPLIIAQHGGGGSPEFCSDMIGENNYTNFTKRALDKGFVVFAPQLLLWGFRGDTGEKFPNFKIEYDRMIIDAKLKQAGYSITGVEVLCIKRSIDYLSTLDEIDADKIGMMGLSYGGFFSLYTAASEKRIKAVYSAASFNDRNKVCFADWSWTNSAKLFSDAEVVGLCVPRKVFIDVGMEDAVFDYRPSQTEAERAKEYYTYYGAEGNFKYNLWHGEHRFDVDSNVFDTFFKAIEI